jgi:4a-hydroxytetrahydrobiopterin dehydratase
METALSKEETNRLLEKLNNWTIREGRLSKEFEFKNFKEAIKFINEIAELSENENHHPEILLTNIKNVRLSLKTFIA